MSRPRLLADHDLNEHLVRGVGRREPAIECIRARDIGMHERSDADRRGSVAGDTRHPQPMPCLGYGALQGCYRGYFSATRPAGESREAEETVQGAGATRKR